MSKENQSFSDEENASYHERRRFQRYAFKCRMRYQMAVAGTVMDVHIGASKNISQAGILINTNYAMPLHETISIELSTEEVKRFVKIEQLQNYIELENCAPEVIRIFGVVVRCNKLGDGSFDVGIHLVNKEESF